MIIAVITAFKPDAGFAERFRVLLARCNAIVVSDNTPGGHTGFDLPPGFTVIHNMVNLGLAPALNAGIREARRLGATTVILFDQDSTPAADFVDRMVHELAHAGAKAGPCCGVGPTHRDDAPARIAEVSAAAIEGARLQPVTCLPTSGMIFPVDTLADDEFFSDEFFLDLVDFEWCWRLRARGWQFFRTREVQMLHRLGEAERRLLGFTFHVPAPYRHYFQFRDSLRLLRKAYVPLYSKLRLTGILPVKALLYPLLLDRGAERLGWMIRGIRDSLTDVHGIGAAAARLSR